MATRQHDSWGASGRYDLQEVIASGGMGTIRRAYDRLGAREVAYKRLRVSIEASRPRLTALFQREFDTLARLDHPNIVQVFDYGFDEEGPYYTMELLSGEDLTRLAPLSYRETCRILRDIASALALLHARRMVHRDVSPNNVRLTGEGRAKLIDFGALSAFGYTRETAGTPAFIAPECLRDEPLDQRTDLYALGALGYWALTRKVPVRAYSLDQLAEALRTPVTPPAVLAPEIPAELDELLMSLLAHDRNARPARAVDVIERLTRIADLAPERSEQVAFGYLKHPPLQGRDAIERTLQQSVDSALAGRGEIVWIEGTPGSGRSALLDRLAVEAQLRGATVLRAEGRVHGGVLGVASHLMHTGLLTFPDVATAFRDRSSVTFFPLDGSEQVQSPEQAAARHARLSTSIQDVLLHLALRSPLVLMVDDVSLADRESIALLAAMVEAIQRHPILLALAATGGQAKSDAEARLSASGKQLALTPLSEPEVEALVQTMFGGAPNSRALALLLYEESGGNPEHCIDLVRQLLRRGALQYVGGAFTIAPDVARVASELRGASLLESRLAGLSATALRVLDTLSLHEGSLAIEQISEASGLASAEVVSTLAQLAELGILVGMGGRYAFASQALRSAVAGSITTADARSLHLAFARMLRSVPTPTLDDRFEAGLQLIRAGAAEALEGAELIRVTVREHPVETIMHGSAVRYLEAALDVYLKQGFSDEQCLDILSPLSGTGFYGDLGAQRRYLDRTMRALSRLSGLALAGRLERYLGPRLALMAGILCASVRRAVRREPRSVTQNITSMVRIATVAVGAAASASNRLETERVLEWLAPLRHSSPGRALRVLYDFCLATLQATSAQYERALASYQSVLARIEKGRMDGLEELARQQLRLGCFNGIGQSVPEGRPALASECADKLEHESVFFAPHAETIRMALHMHRGELEQAEAHRQRAEMLALRGGVSWSALVLLTTRTLHGSMMSDNIIGLVSASAELERLSTLSAGLRAMKEVATAHLALLRGRSEEAVKTLSSLLATDLARVFAMRLPACVSLARALNVTKQHARAKQLCEEEVAKMSPELRALSAAHFGLVEQLALAEAGLDNLPRAIRLLDESIAEASPASNPLYLGSLHRARAQVALLAHDATSFELSFNAMDSWFRSTQNPWLIQQCDALLARAVRAGIRPAAVDTRPLGTLDGSTTDMDGTTQVTFARDEPVDETAPHKKLAQ